VPIGEVARKSGLSAWAAFNGPRVFVSVSRQKGNRSGNRPIQAESEGPQKARGAQTTAHGSSHTEDKVSPIALIRRWLFQDGPKLDALTRS